MIRKLLITALGCFCMLYTAAADQSTGPANSRYTKLAWEENFESPTLDRQSWTFENGTGSQYGIPGWGNNEKQIYQEENISFAPLTGADGNCLVIQAEKNPKMGGGYPYTSARVTTRGLKYFQFGRIEAKMRMPRGQGMWPAFWLIGKDYGPASKWPSCGEIDIVEMKGGINDRGVHGTMHFGKTWPDTWYFLSKSMNATAPLADAFHIYGVEWTPEGIRWYFDNTVYHQEKWSGMPQQDTQGKYINWTGLPFPGQFQAEFYLIINLAVGGNFVNGKLPPNSVFTDKPQDASLAIDWVRYYTE